MKTLIIYDLKGRIIDIKRSNMLEVEPNGVPFMWVDVPKEKYIIKIDTSVEPHIPIFENVPKSKETIEKEALTKILVELTIENKKKEALITQLAQQVNNLNIKISKMEVK